MDKKYIEDNEIEIKYLRNQLSDKELEEFEVYLMENPDAIDRLELDSVFLEETNNVNDSKPISSWLWPINRRTWLTGLGSVSASIIIASMLLPSSPDQSFFDIYSVRGSNSNNPVYQRSIVQKVWPYSSRVTLRVQVDNSKRYSSATISRSSSIKPDLDLIGSYRDPVVTNSGEILLDIQTSLLSSGEYKLVLEQHSDSSLDGINAKKPEWVYFFEVK